MQCPVTVLRILYIFSTFAVFKNSESGIINPALHKRSLNPDMVETIPEISQIYTGRKWQKRYLNLNLIGLKSCALICKRVGQGSIPMKNLDYNKNLNFVYLKPKKQ